MKETIQKLAADFLPEAISLRRHLHAHPELSFQEVKTGRFIADKLAEWGIPHRHGVAENGVVATIAGRNPRKKTIALRADFDALPIEEANDVPYRSQNGGIMHACGHDVHTASLLTTARILFSVRDKFDGSVRLIFQPGEEKLPGGASIMIKEGVLEGPKPAGIIGQHVHPPLAAGTIGLKSGMYMASADEIYVSIKGRGGHGAMPHECIDPVVLAAQIIVGLQQLVSRWADPGVPSVLTFGKINSVGGATNIIPNEVRLEGTFRTMHEKWRSDAHKRMKKMAEGMAKSMGAACEFRVVKGYPTLVNHEELTRRVKKEAIEFLGKSRVVDLPMRMTAEDFAFYTHVVPGCFYRLGTGGEGGKFRSAIHTNTFDIDENALETGAGLMAWLAINELK